MVDRGMPRVCEYKLMMVYCAETPHIVNLQYRTIFDVKKGIIFNKTINRKTKIFGGSIPMVYTLIKKTVIFQNLNTSN